MADVAVRSPVHQVDPLSAGDLVYGAAFVHSPFNGPYVASKAGVWALSNSLLLEVSYYGIDVGTAHPTFVDTPMIDAVRADPAGSALGSGNRNGMWETIRLDEVVDATIRGIQRLARRIVILKKNSLVAYVLGLVQPIIDRFGFRGDTAPTAIALAKARAR